MYTKEFRTLQRLSDYLGEEINREMPRQHLAILIAVVQEPGITMPELVGRLGMPQGTVSRNVKALSTYLREPTEAEIKDGKKGKQRCGYGLLRCEPSLDNRRVLAVYLTTYGMEVAREMARIIREGKTGTCNEDEDDGRIQMHGLSA